MARINFTRAALNSLLATRTPSVKFQSFTDTSGMTVTLRSHADGATILFFCKKRINGTLHTKSLGGYPEVSIDQARYAFLTAAAELIHEGCFKKEEKVKVVKAPKLTLGDVVKKFLDYKEPSLSATTLRNYNNFIKPLSPVLETDYTQVTAAAMWEQVLKPLIDRSPTTAANLSTLLKSIGRYGVAMEFTSKNPFEGLNVLMPKVEVRHFKSFADDELEAKIKELFDKISTLSPKQQAAVHFAFYCPLRNQELRSITVDQVTGADAITVKTKTWDAFTMPLNTQAQRVVKYILFNHRPQRYLLERKVGSMANEHLFTDIFYAAGVDDFVIHGVRSCCMQFLVKCDGVKETIASMCLAHKVGNKTEQAYNRGEYLEERRKAMQLWGDFVEKCVGSNLFYQQTPL